MFQKKIESTFSDPHGGPDEFAKHRQAAIEAFGPDAELLMSNTEGVLDKAGLETIGHKMTTLWQQRGPA